MKNKKQRLGANPWVVFSVFLVFGIEHIGKEQQEEKREEEEEEEEEKE